MFTGVPGNSNDIRFTSKGNTNDSYGDSYSKDSELDINNVANQEFIEKARLQKEQDEFKEYKKSIIELITTKAMGISIQPL